MITIIIDQLMRLPALYCSFVNICLVLFSKLIKRVSSKVFVNVKVSEISSVNALVTKDILSYLSGIFQVIDLNDQGCPCKFEFLC